MVLIAPGTLSVSRVAAIQDNFPGVKPRAWAVVGIEQASAAGLYENETRPILMGAVPDSAFAISYLIASRRLKQMEMKLREATYQLEQDVPGTKKAASNLRLGRELECKMTGPVFPSVLHALSRAGKEFENEYKQLGSSENGIRISVAQYRPTLDAFDHAKVGIALTPFGMCPLILGQPRTLPV